MRRAHISKLSRASIFMGVAFAGVLGTAVNVKAQALKDVQTPDTPLVLKAQGSFFVGGEKVEQTQGGAGRPRSRRAHHRQSDVRAVHGAAGRRRQRARGDGAWRDADGQVVGDHAGRSHGVGRVLRAQGPSRLRPGPGRARAIGVQSGRLQQRARGLGAAGRASRAGSDSATRSSGRTSASVRNLARPIADSQFPVTAVDELSKQGVPDVSFGGVPTPNPTLKALSDLASQVEWRGADGALAVGRVSPGGGAAESRRRQRARARRAGRLSGRTTPTSRSRRWRRCPILVGLRRSPRHADGHRDAALVAALVRGLSGAHRSPQGGWRPGADAQPGRDAASAATAT